MTLAAGTRLGPYEVLSPLGAGGMGEVYEADDPRLGRHVALKVIRSDVTDPGQLARFTREARAVAALSHPNILTVFDVGQTEGTPYIVTELLEGESLRQVAARGSATRRQVVEWSVQAAHGLAAAHRKGIVHRDLKPENLFLTADGRVKILDFGLARQVADAPFDSGVLTESSPTGAGAVVGTLPYLSPEQLEGLPADARSDLFSFGVVLYELVSGRHPFRRETPAATVAAILGEAPPPPSSLDPSIPRALDEIVAGCLKKKTAERTQSARELGQALEALLGAPASSTELAENEDRSPYPGMTSFTERDAALFFGREADVRNLWERIRTRRLLAVIGPSGAGKTSFLRAGIVASRPEGWAVVYATPGSSPAVALARALTPQLSGDAAAIGELIGSVGELTDGGGTGQMVSAFRRWRDGSGEALVILDQFEELFTLNGREVQQRIAGLIERLAVEAGVHVVLSLRDDFLIRCHERPSLAGVFEQLTPLLAVSGDGLRRAIVEPARLRGYGFEDDGLVDELVRSVEGERGALPLLAFAVSCLWERRDREKKLLTRGAYLEIGGVAGALARHAEGAIDRIGAERQGVVRELFRNLVTSQGTRAVMDREELLSAFPDRAVAEEVLGELVDARLLTSYETRAREDEPARQRVEVVHESLLREWPRLARWQAQDEEGVVLRDQLRQAARLWDGKRRTSDLLWTGTAYQEFELWRGRYPGALTSLEEDFGRAMRARAERRRRLVRAAIVASFVGLIAIAAAIGVSRQQAVAAARRAEASKLLALGQNRLAEDPTEALALATASVELADSREARLFALKCLWEAPPALEDSRGSPVFTPAFSPDGRLLATGGYTSDAYVFRQEGGPPAVLKGHWGQPLWASADRLLLVEDNRRVSVWSLPQARLERTIDLGGPRLARLIGPSLLSMLGVRGQDGRISEFVVRSHPVAGGEWVELGRALPAADGPATFAPDGTSLLQARGSTLLALPIAASGRGPATVLGEHLPEIETWMRFGDEVVTWNRAKKVRLFTLEPGKAARVEDFPVPDGLLPPFLLQRGWIVQKGAQAYQLWRRDSWRAARPLSLRRDLNWYSTNQAMHPAGDWLVAATETYTRLTFWPLRTPHPLVVDGFRSQHRLLAFSPDGRWLATSWPEGTIRLWPLMSGSTVPTTLEVSALRSDVRALAFDPGGRFLLVVGASPWIVPTDGRPPVRLEGFSRVPWILAAAVSPSGRSVAAAYGAGEGDRTLRVWDLETGATRAFDLPQPAPSLAGAKSPPLGTIFKLTFAGESTIYSAGWEGVRRWDLALGRQELVIAPPTRDDSVDMVLRPDRGVAVTRWASESAIDSGAPVAVHDLARRSSRVLPGFGNLVLSMDLDPTGRVLVTADRDGILCVGRLSGGEPHLLVGHKGGATAIVSPDLKWIASAGEDNTLRLWPMPDLDRPPLHALPQRDLVATLKSLTNLRAVRDARAPTGWKIEAGPFPGWRDVPTW